MKIAVVLLVVLPLAFSVPLNHEKRLLIDTLFSGPELHSLVQQLTSNLGSDETEKACEAECHVLIQANHLLQHGCPLVCRSLQSLAHRFGINTATTPASV